MMSKHSKAEIPGPGPGARAATGASDESPGGLDPIPEARLWLVDGYNALHCAPFRPDPGGDPCERSTDKSVKGALDGATSKTVEIVRVGVEQPFWSETMRERLVAVARRFPDPDAEIWLIFDGARAAENPERGEQPRLRLLFAPSADDWIVARVREDPEPSLIAVVSGDRKLTGRTRHHGAAVVSPRLFLDYCVLDYCVSEVGSSYFDQASRLGEPD